jgi:hypothetical protein
MTAQFKEKLALTFTISSEKQKERENCTRTLYAPADT